MQNLKEIKELAIMKGLKVEEKDGTLIIKEENVAGIDDIVTFMNDYFTGDGQAVTQNPDGSLTIKSNILTSVKLMILLQTLFGDKYNFNIAGEYEITAVPKKVEKVQETNLMEIAEAIDDDKLKIEVYKEKLVVLPESKEAITTIAKMVDKLFPEAIIEIYEEKLEIKKEQ